MCSQHEQTVDHLYLDSWYQPKQSTSPGTYPHWSICKDHDIEITDKWYLHEPETVIRNKDNNIIIMWDIPVNTDRTITANRPNIIVKDSVNSTCKLIDMTVPSDRNIALKEIEKKSTSTKTQNQKYRECGISVKTVVIPEVVGALGTLMKGMVSNGQATSIITHDFSSLCTIIIIFNYNGIFIIIIPFYRCSKTQERQASKKFFNKCSENSRSQMVFRTYIFRKLTLSAPDDLYCFCASAVHSATRQLTVSTLSPHILSTPGKHFDCQ